MRLTSFTSIKPGEKLAISLFSSNGGRILNAGTAMSEFYIERLQKMGIKLAYVEDERLDDIIYKEPISAETRTSLLQLYKSSIEAIEKGKELKDDDIKTAVKSIVDDVKAAGTPLIILNSLYPEDDAMAYHAINTAIMSVALGMHVGYNFGQLCDVSLAGFIHDIGRNTENDDSTHGHGQRAFEVLRKYRTFNLMSSIVAYEHHEMYNGDGFPRGIKGQDISEFSRIVSVADYFDTLISGINGQSMPAEKAYNEVLNNSDIMFDPEMVKAFKSTIQVYPNGVMVALSDGRQAIVEEQNQGSPLRPIVRLLKDGIPDGRINLREEIDLKIDKVIL